MATGAQTVGRRGVGQGRRGRRPAHPAGPGARTRGPGVSATGPTQKIALRAAQGMFSLIGFDANGWTDPKEQSYDSAA